MTQRNSIGRMLVARFAGLLGSSAGGLAIVGIVLFAVGVVCLDEASAAAECAGPLALGGLLGGLLAAKRSSNQPTRCPSELRRVRVRPLHGVDRNHR